MPVVVTLNRFVTDTEAELDFIKHFCEERDCDFALSEVWEKGGDGGIELGKAVLRTLETKKSEYRPLYSYEDTSIEEKIETIATKIYGADNVIYARGGSTDRKSSLRNLATEIFRSAWRKTSILYLMTRKSLAVRKILILRSAKSM